VGKAVGENESIAINRPLLGTEEAVLDDKGRVLVSKKKRERLGESFTLILGKVGCLMMVPDWAISKLMSDLDEYDMLNPAREDYTRLVLGTAEEDISFDAQGRFVIPARLRQAASLSEKEKLILIGCGDRVEIWTKTLQDDIAQHPNDFGGTRRKLIDVAYSRMTGFDR
jgi:MraZ protein